MSSTKERLIPFLKVAEGQFDRNVEKYIEKSAKDYAKRVQEDRTRQMDKLIDEIGCGDLKIHKIFRIGVPFQELISAVEDEGARSDGHGAKRAQRHGRRYLRIECRKSISSLSDSVTECAVEKAIK